MTVAKQKNNYAKMGKPEEIEKKKRGKFGKGGFIGKRKIRIPQMGVSVLIFRRKCGAQTFLTKF
jgi:hypothetical protein